MAETEGGERKIAPESRPRPRSEEGAGLGPRDRRATQGSGARASEGRSTHFASDLAKGFEIPIIHVNADDPEACLTAARLAYAWRSRWHKDILVDLVGYRRWGHNEGDEPAFTQPRMYEVIRAHPTVRALYAQKARRQRSGQSAGLDAVPNQSDGVPTKRVPRPVS